MLHLSLCCSSSSCCTSLCCTMLHPSSLRCISSCFIDHDCTHHYTAALCWSLHCTKLHPNACCNTSSLPCCPIAAPTSSNTDLHHAALSLLLCALCCTVHHAMYCCSYVHYATLYNMYSLLLPLLYQCCTMYHCCTKYHCCLYVPLLHQLPLLLLCAIVAPILRYCTKHYCCYDCVLVSASLWPKSILNHTHTIP